MSNQELTHGLTLKISTDAGDVLLTATLCLTPPQAVQLAELLNDYAFQVAVRLKDSAFQAQPNTRPETPGYAASLAAIWPPGKAAAPRRRRKKEPHAGP